jgi:hypothetical protein
MIWITDFAQIQQCRKSRTSNLLEQFTEMRREEILSEKWSKLLKTLPLLIFINKPLTVAYIRWASASLHLERWLDPTHLIEMIQRTKFNRARNETLRRSNSCKSSSWNEVIMTLFHSSSLHLFIGVTRGRWKRNVASLQRHIILLVNLENRSESLWS